MVGDAQLLIAPVEGKRARAERDGASFGFEYRLALHSKEHEIRGAVAMRGQSLARAQPDNPDIGLRAFEKWLRNHSIVVVSRGVAQADDVHCCSIAQGAPRLRQFRVCGFVVGCVSAVDDDELGVGVAKLGGRDASAAIAFARPRTRPPRSPRPSRRDAVNEHAAESHVYVGVNYEAA